MLGLTWSGTMLGVLALLCPAATHAQDDGRGPVLDKDLDGTHFEAGIALHFMPIGWFELSDTAGRDFRAYPAYGVALFVEHVLHRYFSVGIAPEVTLNVIPNRAAENIASMINLAARVQARYPGHVTEPYAIVTGGYSLISREASGRAWGPVVGASLGVRLWYTKRRSVFGELGYQKGFQRADGSQYGPSYLIIGAGLQFSF